MIRILVCFKVTHEVEYLTPQELKTICYDNLDMTFARRIIDSDDEAALEAGLRLRDMAIAQGIESSLVALTVGACEGRFIKDIFAVNYDRIIQIPCDDDLSFQPEKVAAAVCDYALEAGGFDVLLTGQRSTIGQNAQTPYLIAVRLGLPCISNLTDIELCDGKIKVTAQTDIGFRTALIGTPAVYAMGNAVHPYLRIATLRNRLASASKAVTCFPAGDFSPRMGVALLKELIFRNNEKKCTFIHGETVGDKIRVLWEQYIKRADV